jgi:DNA-binding MarR family transcriptional regulator
MTDTAPDEQAASAQPAGGGRAADHRPQGSGRPATARELGIRWGDHWDDTPLDGLPVPRLAPLAARLIATYWWYTAEGTGVSPAGLGMLAVLEEEDGLRSGEVAARSWISPPMVSYLADVLERDGYVIRRKDPADRRVVHLHLTREGRQKLRDARQHVAVRWQMAFSYLEPADEPVIRRFLLSTVGRFGDLIDQEQR